MKNTSFGLQRLLSDGPKSTPSATNGPMEGVVLDVTDDMVIFTIPEYDPLQRFGPAFFCRTATPPQPGDRCLVLFVGAGIDRPWVVSWRAG